MSQNALSSGDRIRVSTRLAQLRDVGVNSNREDVCREISALRQTIRNYDSAVRKGYVSEGLSNAGVATTVIGPFFLFGGPLAAVAGIALTLAGPLLAVSGWIVSEDREVKLGWIQRMLDDIYDLSMRFRCADFH